eukprot:549853-Amphidinium_carterae.1
MNLALFWDTVPAKMITDRPKCFPEFKSGSFFPAKGSRFKQKHPPMDESSTTTPLVNGTPPCDL